MSDNNGGPAFPSANDVRIGDYGTSGHSGMTLRDYFAANADVTEYTPIDAFERSFGRSPTIKELAEYIAQIRLVEADAMLAAREKGCTE